MTPRYSDIPRYRMSCLKGSSGRSSYQNKRRNLPLCDYRDMLLYNLFTTMYLDKSASISYSSSSSSSSSTINLSRSSSSCSSSSRIRRLAKVTNPTSPAPTTKPAHAKNALIGIGFPSKVRCVRASSPYCEKLTRPDRQMIVPYTRPNVAKPKTLVA